MRVDVTKRKVGSFFGGKPSASVSETCPVCAKPGLLIRSINRGTKTTRYYAHAFEIKLNEKNESECLWDEPCVERPAKQEKAS